MVALRIAALLLRAMHRNAVSQYLCALPGPRLDLAGGQAMLAMAAAKSPWSLLSTVPYRLSISTM